MPAAYPHSSRSRRTSHVQKSLSPSSLAFALEGAACVLASVRAGQALPAALKAYFHTHALGHEQPARGAIQDIAYRTLRSLGLADALLTLLAHKEPLPHLANLLVCALTLLAENKEHAAYTPFTVVDQAVDAASARPDTAFAKGFVNGALRQFVREPQRYLESARKQATARWNYPLWWIKAVQKHWPTPATWSAILEAGNAQAPLILRVNARKTSVPAYLQLLHNAEIPACAVAQSPQHDSPCHPQAVLIFDAMPVHRLPGFAEGLFAVQDAGAQYAAPLLDAQPGMRVLDACAAPGGKTCHLAELADLELLALDTDEQRIGRIQENLDRLGMPRAAQVQLGDAANPAAWWNGQAFDRILADVPCSGSGIVRRHPDIRWLKRPEDIPAFVAQQRRILTALWPLLKKGGRLLYVTCSLFPEEGEQQAQWLCASYSDARRLDAPGQLLPTCFDPIAYHARSETPSVSASSTAALDAPLSNPPPLYDHDGFFYALFEKQ